MPLVKMEIKKGHSAAYKKTLVQTVHEALRRTLMIPDDDRKQRLYELDQKHFETGGAKTSQFVIIELTLFPGRSKAVKRDVIQAMTGLLGERLGISPRMCLLSATNRWTTGACAANKPANWDCTIKKSKNHERVGIMRSRRPAPSPPPREEVGA